MSSSSSPLPDDQDVFRGLRNSNWVDRKGDITFKAFMLRPATENYPIETDLSVGRTPDSSVDELKEHYGCAKMPIVGIHSLPHGLTVVSDPTNSSKAAVLGLPLYSQEKEQRDLALAVASDLANVSRFHPI
jgi:hypothetical protein